MAFSKEYIPGNYAEVERVFRYPFFTDKETKDFINIHGKIMFIVRGPPGTRKLITSTLMYHYPSGIKCTADDYCSKSCAPFPCISKSLKESYMYYDKIVKEECEKGTHPVVVSNTHVWKLELQKYLNYAQEYGYTVIFANALDKILIGKEYFRYDIRSWEDIFPDLMGWFLNEDDSFYLFHQLHFALDALLQDESFCRDFNVFNKDLFSHLGRGNSLAETNLEDRECDEPPEFLYWQRSMSQALPNVAGHRTLSLGRLLNRYRAKKTLFCMAGFCKSSPSELKEYYKSTKVREAYGKCFTLPVQAYIITKSDIFAMVLLDEALKSLIFKQNFEDNSHDEKNIAHICRDIRSMYFRYYEKCISLNSDFSNKCKTAYLSDKSNDYLKIDESSFIHIAERSGKKISPYELSNLLKSSFNGIIDGNGKLTADKFSELKDGYKSCKLHEDAWVVVLPKDLAVKTVFTGLYIWAD